MVETAAVTNTSGRSMDERSVHQRARLCCYLYQRKVDTIGGRVASPRGVRML